MSTSTNIAIGQEAGKGCAAASGLTNISIGIQAGFCLSSGNSNIFLGNCAGRYNDSGNCNIFIGPFAGYCNASTYYNVAIGYQSGYNFAGAYNNTFLGFQAGLKTTSGNTNTFLGTYAGYCNTSGNNNIAIGRWSGVTGVVANPAGLINLTTGGNCIVMGNCLHSCAAIQVAWTVISDIRDKCVYGDVPHGKGFLQNVNPIKYSFKDRETGEVTDERVRYGFSAQEIAELEGDETIIASKSNADKWGVTHEHLLPVLVNAIKELDAENKELKERLTTLEERVNSLLES